MRMQLGWVLILVTGLLLAGCTTRDQKTLSETHGSAAGVSADTVSHMVSSASAPAMHDSPVAPPPPALMMRSSAPQTIMHAQTISPASGESYAGLPANVFLTPDAAPLSTFSIDVDTASYSNIRRMLQDGMLPPAAAVRVEEMINYFPYTQARPTGEHPFSVKTELAVCPWTSEHQLLRIALKGKTFDDAKRPAANLVYLVDVSGSMASADKLPLLVQGFKLSLAQLDARDRVGIVVYAGQTGVALEPTVCDAHGKEKIVAALDRLYSGGSTNGAGGIEEAYRLAEAHFVPGGVNRVLLATDGDFNVGITGQEALTALITEKAKSGVFLTVLGFGTGNLKDSTMELLADKGNGNYAYVDGISEARKVLVEQAGGTLITIAKDVKIQVEFNPAEIAAYRLVGYENRMLAAEDFNDDKKDAGEIGAGHTVTALYELVPKGVAVPGPSVDPLKYQKTEPLAEAADNLAPGELLTVKLRYKAPDGDASKLLRTVVRKGAAGIEATSEDMRFASAIAAFGMLLSHSRDIGNYPYDAAIALAQSAKGDDPEGLRAEAINLMKTARDLMPVRQPLVVIE